MSVFVGRRTALAELLAAYDAVAAVESEPPRVGIAILTGEAGIGKSTLLAEFVAAVHARDGTSVWGTCWDADQTPALWAWTQALRTLLSHRPDLAVDLEPDLGPVVVLEASRAEAIAQAPADTEGGSRLRVFDAVVRLLGRAVQREPLVVVLDDLQWCDRSSVDLMRFVVRSAGIRGLLLVGAYRPEDIANSSASVLHSLSSLGSTVHLSGLSPTEVAELLDSILGPAEARRWAEIVHARTAGHPLFAAELGRALSTSHDPQSVPAAIRDAVMVRIERLSPSCVDLLGCAAVTGPELMPGLLARLTASPGAAVPELIEEAVRAGVLIDGEPVRFAHDLFRESIYANLPARVRIDLHARCAGELAERRARGLVVFAAELARHAAAAVPVSGPAPAIRWARLAAAEEVARFAFSEAAGHLARARAAIERSGADLAAAELIDLMAAEADLELRAGQAGHARELLDAAWTLAVREDDAETMAAVALGMERVGARFAMPRGDLLAVLERARSGVAGTDTPSEARLTAALARQLQHSVPRERPRAAPLAARAVELARRADDPAMLASCLLAQHDVLWTPGTGERRARIAEEIAALAARAGDLERRAQGLLLTASAQLEGGSPVFRATIAEFGYVTEQLREPRHEYLLRTRRAALALLDGDIATGAAASRDAAVLGGTVGDSDTGNVEMSQRLEIARARGQSDELRATAAAAVQWWVGAPGHAHAIAAGFLARAGDLSGARRELAVALGLDALRGDRSYLWSVFVGELVSAAVALDERRLCRELLRALTPLGGTCAVNGAFVCFMGSHAHRIGLLQAALGDRVAAAGALRLGLDTHVRLGARAWEADSHTALAALGGPDSALHAQRAAELRAELELAPRSVHRVRVPMLERTGDVWWVGFGDRTAQLRDAKGLRDLSVLIAHPGVDVPAVELAGAVVSASSVGPVLDRTALAAYHARLAYLDAEIADADLAHAGVRREQAVAERQRLAAELRRATRPGGLARPLGTSTAERARKAVSARIRDAIRHLGHVLPELGTHLDRTVSTGHLCRYDPGLDER